MSIFRKSKSNGQREIWEIKNLKEWGECENEQWKVKNNNEINTLLCRNNNKKSQRKKTEGVFLVIRGEKDYEKYEKEEDVVSCKQSMNKSETRGVLVNQ